MAEAVHKLSQMILARHLRLSQTRKASGTMTFVKALYTRFIDLFQKTDKLGSFVKLVSLLQVLRRSQIC